jgi:hypothetical protein
MSSSISREPLAGTIRQNQRIVGAICLPEEDLQEFIEQFNNCYGPMQLHIDPPAFMPLTSPALFPVGATHRRPPGVPQPRVNPGLPKAN